jgi:hypothetical protein
MEAMPFIHNFETNTMVTLLQTRPYCELVSLVGDSIMIHLLSTQCLLISLRSSPSPSPSLSSSTTRKMKKSLAGGSTCWLQVSGAPLSLSTLARRTNSGNTVVVNGKSKSSKLSMVSLPCDDVDGSKAEHGHSNSTNIDRWRWPNRSNQSIDNNGKNQRIMNGSTTQSGHHNDGEIKRQSVSPIPTIDNDTVVDNKDNIRNGNDNGVENGAGKRRRESNTDNNNNHNNSNNNGVSSLTVNRSSMLYCSSPPYGNGLPRSREQSLPYSLGLHVCSYVLLNDV